ncbi:hypothetical protein AB4Z21_30040 [Paenibacillus sp. MCAF20]
MSNENRQKMQDKHFEVIINNKKTKILNYSIENRSDDLTGEVVKILTIKTKIFSEVFKDKEIQIMISNDGNELKINGTYKGVLLQPGLRNYIYKVE